MKRSPPGRPWDRRITVQWILANAGAYGIPVNISEADARVLAFLGVASGGTDIDLVDEIEATFAAHMEAKHLPEHQVYDIALYYPGRPAPNEIVLAYVGARPTVFSSTMPGQARLLVPATRTATFALEKNGSYVGNFTFSPENSLASFAIPEDIGVFAGDMLLVRSPNPTDETLSGLALTLLGRWI